MMTDFETILAQFDEPSRAADPTSLLRSAALAGAFDEHANATRRDGETKGRAALVAAAYGTLAPERQSEAGNAPPSARPRAPRLPDRESLLRELRVAGNSIDDLRALRRRLAWMCHPDRHEDANARRAEKLMAEFNARIDAAMKILSRREG